MATRRGPGRPRRALALVLVLVVAVILTLIGAGLLQICYGVRVQAARVTHETIALLAAEAGYEKAILWMGQQPDVLTGLTEASSGSSGTISFEGSRCEYAVQFQDFIGARPVFRILSTGYSGSARRTVDVYVMQAVTGWDMGMCRVPSGALTSEPVYFAEDETLDMPIHINNLKDVPDNRDIYISGSPRFTGKVEMGESRYAGRSDKYGSVMGLFQGGITFDQPDVKITNDVAVQSKIDRFRNSTNPAFIFTPIGTANVLHAYNAVQLEFFVESAVGKVRITNNCTVRGYPNGVRDYRVAVGSHPITFEKYDTYAYHYKPSTEASVTVPIESTYVQQVFAGHASESGGQIFVNGNVVIGSESYDQMVVKGKLTIVATGNIWIADSIIVDGALHGGTYVPNKNNPNVLGLIARGVVKVIDPGLANYDTPPATVQDRNVGPAKTHAYVPVANGTTRTNRYLPDPTIVIAAITVGGGGWGAENVGFRKERSGTQDDLIVIGAISEVVRGVVGLVDSDGYVKKYTIDERLLEGVLPGNIWFGGKYIPAPAGWHDYRPSAP